LVSSPAWNPWILHRYPIPNDGIIRVFPCSSSQRHLEPSPSFLLFLIVRYTRLRVVAAESPLGVRLSEGPQQYQRVFGRMAQTTPVITLATILGTLILAIYASSGILPAIPWLIAVNAFVVYFDVLAFSTYLWEFTIASLGLYKLGGASLKLASFLEHRMMGARHMGNLALSLTTAYFGGLLVTYLLFATFLPSNVAASAMLFAFLLGSPLSTPRQGPVPA